MPASAQEEDRLIRFKAVFVYYFIDYIRWPATESSEPFKIGLLGNSPLEEPLKEIANTHQNGRYLAASSVDEISRVFGEVMQHIDGALRMESI